MSMPVSASSKTSPRSRHRPSASRYRAAPRPVRPRSRPGPRGSSPDAPRRSAFESPMRRCAASSVDAPATSPPQNAAWAASNRASVDARGQLGGLPVSRLIASARRPAASAAAPRASSRLPPRLRSVLVPTRRCDLGQDVLDVIAPERGHERGIGEELDPVLGRGAIGQGLGEDRHGAVPLAEPVVVEPDAARKTEASSSAGPSRRERARPSSRIEDVADGSISPW